MVLGHWFERGLGQLLAPDHNYQDQAEVVDTRSTFWQWVAPDPNFASSSSSNTTSRPRPVPPAAAFRTAAVMSSSAASSPQQGLVECIHCHRPTPIQPAVVSSTTHQSPWVPGKNSGESDTSPSPHMLRTPSPTKPSTARSSQPTYDQGGMMTSSLHQDDRVGDVEQRILSACKEMAQASTYPPGLQAKLSNLFTWFSSAHTLPDKILDKIKSLLQENPELARLRSYNCTLCPDGLTLLQAAAHSNQLVAAQLLLHLSHPTTGELLVVPADLLLDTNPQGQTALHMAADKGHLEVLTLLQQHYQAIFGQEAVLPQDITGRTPFAAAMTSPNPKARKHREAASQKLFSPQDPSVRGTPAPVQHRGLASAPLALVVGVADMPGRRVTMEDAAVVGIDPEAAAAWVAVCDGHADGGAVARFVADAWAGEWAAAARQNQAWDWSLAGPDMAASIEARLKKTDLTGGCTAVTALITPHQIVVANLGDCRCILIQRQALHHRPDDAAAPPTETMGQLSLQDVNLQDAAVSPVAVSTDTPQPEPSYGVLALSHDHKPSLAEEKARIERAGLKVVEERFMEKGEEVVISKIELATGDMMACSRSFGDFEYKANKELADFEQAVVAVPDVMIHERQPQNDAYLVLACDGVWDVMTNDDVAQFVVDKAQHDGEGVYTMAQVADALLMECLRRGSGDNMSVVVVALSDQAEKLGTHLPERKMLDFAPFRSP